MCLLCAEASAGPWGHGGALNAVSAGMRRLAGWVAGWDPGWVGAPGLGRGLGHRLWSQTVEVGIPPLLVTWAASSLCGLVFPVCVRWVEELDMSGNLESLSHLLTWNELWYHQVGQVDGCWEPRRSGRERGCCPAQPFHTALRPTRRVGDSCPLLLYSFPRRGEEVATPPPRSLPPSPQPGLVPLVPQSWAAALHLWNVDPNPPGVGSLYSSPASCPPPFGHPLHHPRLATK